MSTSRAKRLKIIQINIWKGKFLDDLVSFLKTEDPDIVTMQEVSGGAENNHEDKTLDVFQELKKRLGLNGVLAVRFRMEGDPASYVGNAVLTKGEVVSHETVWFKPYQDMSPEEWRRDYIYGPNNAIDCFVNAGGVQLRVISVHGAWTKNPVDTPEKVRQAVILKGHIQKLGGTPFLIGGDMNEPPSSQVIRSIEEVARNATTTLKSSVTRSTHPKIHKTVSFRPEGLLVDYIFTSKHFDVLSVDAPEVTVSDHLPIRAVLEYRA